MNVSLLKPKVRPRGNVLRTRLIPVQGEKNTYYILYALRKRNRNCLIPSGRITYVADDDGDIYFLTLRGRDGDIMYRDYFLNLVAARIAANHKLTEYYK